MATIYNNKPLSFLVIISVCRRVVISLAVIGLLTHLSGCSKQKSVGNVLPGLHWIEDKSGAMTLSEVIAKDLSTHWNESAGTSLNLGFTDSVIWISLPINNSSNRPLSKLLTIPFPLHDSIDVYILDGRTLLKTYHAGDRQPFDARPLDHRHFLFPYTVAPKTSLRAIARVQTTHSMYLPVNLWDTNAFIVQDQRQSLLLGMFLGTLLIMAVYNLCLYLSTRHKNYLYYFWFVGAIIYLHLVQKNIGFQYLWPQQPLFNHVSFPVSSFLTIATSGLFLMGFLGVSKKSDARIFYVFKALIFIALLGIPCSAVILYLFPTLVPYNVLVLSTAVFGALTTIVTMIILISLSLQGNSTARIVSFAWLSLLAGSLLFALGRMGVPLPMMLTENAMLIGSTFEAALISFALAMHIKKEREGRIQAQAQALDNERKTLEAQNSLLKLQEGVREQLEQEVEERTLKLKKAMLRLEDANHKLNNLARLDALTGLSNRRDFDQTFNKVWQDSIVSKQPISLLMADIDHFKKLNDNYGHIFGDKCLVEVAAILKQCMNQPDFVAARFGGEEFIMLLPNTETSAAAALAEKVRRRIETFRFNTEGREIRFTISIGLANTIPTAQTNNADLIVCADEALYQAKENGRNRVIGANSQLMPSKYQGTAIVV